MAAEPGCSKLYLEGCRLRELVSQGNTDDDVLETMEKISEVPITLSSLRATHIGKIFQMQLCKHHDPVIRSLAKKQVVTWRKIAKDEQANYLKQTLAIKILQQQELEELPLETEPEIERKQTGKPTLSRMQAARRIQRFATKRLAWSRRTVFIGQTTLAAHDVDLPDEVSQEGTLPVVSTPMKINTEEKQKSKIVSKKKIMPKATLKVVFRKPKTKRKQRPKPKTATVSNGLIMSRRRQSKTSPTKAGVKQRPQRKAGKKQKAASKTESSPKRHVSTASAIKTQFSTSPFTKTDRKINAAIVTTPTTTKKPSATKKSSTATSKKRAAVSASTKSATSATKRSKQRTGITATTNTTPSATKKTKKRLATTATTKTTPSVKKTKKKRATITNTTNFATSTTKQSKCNNADTNTKKDEIADKLASIQNSRVVYPDPRSFKFAKLAFWPDPVKITSDDRLAVVRLRLILDGQLDLRQVTAEDIIAGRLLSEGFAALFVPGGFVNNYENALGMRGRRQIHAFLEAGRGFVGECAGAFLATSDYFGFVEKVRVEHIQNWKRGRSNDCVMRMTAHGRDILRPNQQPSDLLDSMVTRYCNGPVLSISPPDESESDPESEPEEADPHPLCREQVWSVFDFESEFCGKKNQLSRVMRKQPAIVVAYYGHKVNHGVQGRLVLISPHPADSEPLMHRLHYPNLVRWACHLPALAEGPIWDSYSLAPQPKKGSTELARVERFRWRIDTSKAERMAVLRLAWLAGREVKFRPKDCAKDQAAALQRLLANAESSAVLEAVLAGKGRVLGQDTLRKLVGPTITVCKSDSTEFRRRKLVQMYLEVRALIKAASTRCVYTRITEAVAEMKKRSSSARESSHPSPTRASANSRMARVDGHLQC